MIPYIPRHRERPAQMLPASAWGDIPTILKDIIDRFGIGQKAALEFGVEYGYSTVALSNYFESVTGVDTFTGDVNSGIKPDHYELTKKGLSKYKNIKLIQATYQDFTWDHKGTYDLIHIDIVHNYEHTHACGKWAMSHAGVVIFHDTESYGEVKQACIDLSQEFGTDFYNYADSYGLGILTKKPQRADH